MTRIIAGRFRRRQLSVPEGQDVRPTTDRMRERLFSMLMKPDYPDLNGARVADLFAGTGALGLEALSRGAGHATFVETGKKAQNAIKANIKTLGAEKETRLVSQDAARVTRPDAPYDILFMDPPYREGLIPPTLKRLHLAGWLADPCLIVAECATDEELDLPEWATILDDRSQGIQRLLFLGVKEP